MILPFLTSIIWPVQTCRPSALYSPARLPTAPGTLQASRGAVTSPRCDVQGSSIESYFLMMWSSDAFTIIKRSCAGASCIPSPYSASHVGVSVVIIEFIRVIPLEILSHQIFIHAHFLAAFRAVQRVGRCASAPITCRAAAVHDAGRRRTRRWSTTAAPRLRFVAHWFTHILSAGHARRRAAVAQLFRWSAGVRAGFSHGSSEPYEVSPCVWRSRPR